MTNNEINLRIARIRNTIPKENPDWNEVTLGHYQDMPDYINDPARNRELELELMERGWLPIIYHIGKRGKYGYANSLCYGPRNDDFGKVTCLAWIEEFGND